MRSLPLLLKKKNEKAKRKAFHIEKSSFSKVVKKRDTKLSLGQPSRPGHHGRIESLQKTSELSRSGPKFWWRGFLRDPERASLARDRETGTPEKKREASTNTTSLHTHHTHTTPHHTHTHKQHRPRQQNPLLPNAGPLPTPRRSFLSNLQASKREP